jgi:hypothetical protein
MPDVAPVMIATRSLSFTSYSNAPVAYPLRPGLLERHSPNSSHRE